MPLNGRNFSTARQPDGWRRRVRTRSSAPAAPAACISRSPSTASAPSTTAATTSSCIHGWRPLKSSKCRPPITRRIRRACRRERAAAAEIRRQHLPRIGLRLRPQRQPRCPELLRSEALAETPARSAAVRRGGWRPGPSQSDLLHGSYEGVRETRETVAQTNVLTAAMRRGDLLRGRRCGGQGSVHESAVPEQHHSAESPRSLRDLDDQRVPAAAQPDRREQLPGPDPHRRHAAPVHHPGRPCHQSKQKIFGHYLYQGRDNPRSRSTRRFRRRASSTTRAWQCSTSRRGVPPS